MRGGLESSFTSESINANLSNVFFLFVLLQLLIKICFISKEPRKIKQFQVKFWPDAAQKPRSAKELLDLMELVHLWQRNTGNNPVIVHCMYVQIL